MSAICTEELQIIYVHGRPTGIRDKGGYLVYFPRIHHYENQEERYQSKLAQQARLADYLLASLKATQK